MIKRFKLTEDSVSISRQGYAFREIVSHLRKIKKDTVETRAQKESAKPGTVKEHAYPRVLALAGKMQPLPKKIKEEKVKNEKKEVGVKEELHEDSEQGGAEAILDLHVEEAKKRTFSSRRRPSLPAALVEEAPKKRRRLHKKISM